MKKPKIYQERPWLETIKPGEIFINTHGKPVRLVKAELVYGLPSCAKRFVASIGSEKIASFASQLLQPLQDLVSVRLIDTRGCSWDGFYCAPTTPEFMRLYGYKFE